MGNNNQSSFSVRGVKGGYILSLSSPYAIRGNESIHPSIDDLIQAIRFELENPTQTTPTAGLGAALGATAGYAQTVTTHN